MRISLNVSVVYKKNVKIVLLWKNMKNNNHFIGNLILAFAVLWLSAGCNSKEDLNNTLLNGLLISGPSSVLASSATSGQPISVHYPDYASMTEPEASNNKICNAIPGSENSNLDTLKTYPDDLAKNVPVNSKFIAYFNKPLDCQYINETLQDMIGSASSYKYITILERFGSMRYSSGSFAKDYTNRPVYVRCSCNRLEITPVRDFIPNEKMAVTMKVKDNFGYEFNPQLGVSSSSPKSLKTFIFQASSDCILQADSATQPAGDRPLSVCSSNLVQDEPAFVGPNISLTFNKPTECIGGDFYPTRSKIVLYEYTSATSLKKIYGDVVCTAGGRTITFNPCELKPSTHYNVYYYGNLADNYNHYNFGAGNIIDYPNVNVNTTSLIPVYGKSFTTDASVNVSRTDGICGAGTADPTPVPVTPDDGKDEDICKRLK